MATNPYFSYKVKSEQSLIQDLIIESIKFYGQDVYYLPREIVNKDPILLDDVPSRFSKSYKIEMYIENPEGWDGEGDIFTKFGVELRDQGTFIVARKRWKELIGQRLIENNFRPREGDLIYLDLSKSIFEIKKVETESPFYQLSQLPIFRMQCELFEYNDEDFDTGISDIDSIEYYGTYQYKLTLDSSSSGYVVGEIVRQTFSDSDYVMEGEVVHWSDSDNVLKLAHVGASDGDFHSFSTNHTLVGLTSGSVTTPTLVEQLQNIDNENQAEKFDNFETDFMDFSERNPFGDPF